MVGVVYDAEGSSPLARGLRPQGRCRPPDVGIIPARAGFTPRRGRPGPHLGDHPRSRGVYLFSLPSNEKSPGSSPLARGLRDGERGYSSPRRIIPARAGFTRAALNSKIIDQDHPRSRGVYGNRVRQTRFGQGSSPLARGLQGREEVDHIRVRIIPARAGFTHFFAPFSLYCADHPRSRGVYSPRTRSILKGIGSSPLARGLLPH